MTGDKAVTDCFRRRNAHADMALIEGNRGLFDGFDVEGTHSFSELVKLLGVPLLLVMECSKASRSIAALVHGCNTFDEKLRIGGVILNHIAGERHRSLVTAAIEKYCRVPVLGIMPRIHALPIRERHLGLVPVYEHGDPEKLIDLLGDLAAENIDLDAVTELAGRYVSDCAHYSSAGRPAPRGIPAHAAAPRVGVVRDSAFNFYYPENLEKLEQCGAVITGFNSLEDASIGEIDALYIGGGFPETHAERLSNNTGFRSRIRDLVEEGLPVYAECGGLVYLSRSIRVGDNTYPMAGVLPMDFEISSRPEGHGYTILEADRQNPFYASGTTVRGHEFRYSRIVNGDAAESLSTIFKVRRGRGIAAKRDGILYKNTLAIFSHTHACAPGVTWIPSLVEMARSKMRVCRRG
jgi:cobyrinic acid a,c-diamide synthase